MTPLGGAQREFEFSQESAANGDPTNDPPLDGAIEN